jgi:alpha-beta hydrolase superfamily lysophospholipase
MISTINIPGESNMQTTFTFSDSDGFKIFVYKWSPPGGVKPKAAVQIAHGAAEHGGRYARFGEFLAANGYVVYADDHRGHGKTAGTLEKAGIVGETGWDGMMESLHELTGIIKKENPGLPLIFFGHSMGSMMAQRFMQLWGDEPLGVVLSGTFGSLGEDIDGTIAAAEGLVAQLGPDGPSELFASMFVSFAEPFPPVKTGFEWLSRDETEVGKYVDDPFCGFPFSNGLVVELFKGGKVMWSPEEEAKIPKDLPIYMIAGEKDPAGGFTAAVTQLIERYQAQGLTNVTYTFYPDARHEVLNETNRNEVHQDVLDWMESLL